MYFDKAVRIGKICCNFSLQHHEVVRFSATLVSFPRRSCSLYASLCVLSVATTVKLHRQTTMKRSRHHSSSEDSDNGSKQILSAQAH